MGGDWKAEAAFWLRQRMRISFPAWKRPAGSFAAVGGAWNEDERARFNFLRDKYSLDGWGALCNGRELLECLHLLDVFDRHVVPAVPLISARRAQMLRCLDVGAKNGSALPALVSAVPGRWDMIELDANRRYLNLSTRRAHGHEMAHAFPGCRFIAGSVVELPGPYHVISWILPFVREAPLTAWGLPRRFFEPERLLAHVMEILSPSGVLFIINQGEREREAQVQLLEDQGLPYEEVGEIRGPFSPFINPRYGFLIRKT